MAGGSVLAAMSPALPAFGSISGPTTSVRSSGGDGADVVDIVPGDRIFDMVAAVTNPNQTSSDQYGYFASLAGFTQDELFRGPRHDESTARFTFFTVANTLAALVEGPVLYLWRTGQTTIYQNRRPADFDDRDTFRSGTPIVTSDLTNQQAMIEAEAGFFHAINRNKITRVRPVRVGDRVVRWGSTGEAYATYIRGVPLTPSTGTWTGVGLGAESEIE